MIVKKSCALLLAILYLVTANGAIINFHYCMGRLAGMDISASAPASGNCGTCGMAKEKKSGCCNDEHKTVKLSDDRLLSIVNNAPAAIIHYLYDRYPSSQNRFLAAQALASQPAHNPPLLTTPLFALHCVFRL